MIPDPPALARARARWQYRGDARPDFADDPRPGQESVWDYPRPPRIDLDPRPVRVTHGAIEIAHSSRALRILETAGPPTFYLPPEDIRRELLVPSAGESLCEWKGIAGYWSVQSSEPEAEAVAWSYREPFSEFERIRDYLSFYPARVACWVAGERVQPQPGGFYGGWVTDELTGPFKGEPGSEDW